MQYLLIIYQDETEVQEIKRQNPNFMKDYGDLARQLVESGEMRGGQELEPTSMATTVRVRNGDVLLTDGPFAETREQLAGFFLIEAKNLDRAIEIARRIPSVHQGCIEIRPIRMLPTMG